MGKGLHFKPTLSSIEAGNITSMSYNASLNGQEVVANLDPGASHAFMSTKAALSCGLSIFNSDHDEVELGDHSTTVVHGMASGTLKLTGTPHQLMFILFQCLIMSTGNHL